MSYLKQQGYDTISLADIKSTIDNLHPNAQAVNTIMSDAAKNGAPQSVLSAIGKAIDVQSAIAAASNYMRTSSDPQMGRYLDYSQQAKAAGHQPEDFATFKAADDASIAN